MNIGIHRSEGGFEVKRGLLLAVLISSIVIASCGRPIPLLGPTPTPIPPPAEETAQAFLKAWEQGDYARMYGLLSPSSRASIDLGKFKRIYQDVAAEATITSVSTSITSALQEPPEAQVAYHVSMETLLVGSLEVDNVMNLTLEGERWGVNWSSGLIFPELAGNFVHLEVRTPERGDIYDRHGLELATDGTMVTVGVVPGWIKDEGKVLHELKRILGLDEEAIRGKYASARPYWFVPIGDIPLETYEAERGFLDSLPGISCRKKSVRAYPQGELASHVVGYLGAIPSDELEHWKAKGYRGDEKIGVAGLEKWGEECLAGRRGGALTIITSRGDLVAMVKEQPAVSGCDIYTTLDAGLQRAAEAALEGKRGAVVALDPRNGQILAMASRPGFDPNIFVPGISYEEWEALLNDEGRPLVNRAIQCVYPIGSVFKVVTMACALEEGGFTPDSTFTCTGVWEGLGPEHPMHCWLQAGHGEIDLVTALAASCNVAFYEIGLKLYELDPSLLSDYARRFGLGKPTGLRCLDEEAGLIPGPIWKMRTLGEGWAPGDGVNLAIGQANLRLTPLQVANMMASIANGGVIYRPQLILRVVGTSGELKEAFSPEVMGHLPLSERNLKAIQRGLLGTTTDPRGTADEAFRGLGIPVAGKTGTAELGEEGGKPHSWFAGYAPADDPQIAMAVIVEHGGEGGKVAAPIFRKLVEAYFQQGGEGER